MDELSLIRLSKDFQCYATSEPSAQYLDLKFIFVEIFETETYRNDVEAIPEDGVVLDIGANVGLFSVLVKSLKKNANIHAFEPMPGTFAALRRNIEAHKLVNVTAHQVAIGATEEDAVEFTYFPFAPGNSTRYPRCANPLITRGATTHNVSVTTISSALKEISETEHIDLVKIDVEGGEAEILRGIAPLEWERIKSFVVEVEDTGLGEPENLRRVFEERDYAVDINPHPMLPTGGHLFMAHATKN